MPGLRRFGASLRTIYCMDEKLLPEVPFTFDVDFKSIDSEKPIQAVELEDGQLLIEGWGANYDIDRENEAFEDGAFTKGLKKFLSGNAPLLYHHQYSNVIGKVVDAETIPGKGVKIKAIVDRQPEASPLRHIYEGIKRGRINGLSCGGIFKRRMTKSGPKIHDVELLEWSATPVPVGRGTQFSVIAGKALQAPLEGKAEEISSEIIPPGAEESHDCEECKKRAEAEEARAEAERKVDEAAAKEKADAEAAAKEAAEKEAAVTESEEEPPEEEKPDEEAPEDNEELTTLFNRLDSLASRLETIGERWEKEPEASSEQEAAEESKDIVPEGFSSEEIEEAKSEFELVKAGSPAASEDEGKAFDNHSSTTHPGLERSFRKNWVEKVGGFPRHNWIYRCAKHLVADAGMSVGHAIAVAVNAAKKLCASGDLNLPGKQSANPGSRAEACAAVAEWEAMKAKSKAD